MREEKEIGCVGEVIVTHPPLLPGIDETYWNFIFMTPYHMQIQEIFLIITYFDVQCLRQRHFRGDDDWGNRRVWIDSWTRPEDALNMLMNEKVTTWERRNSPFKKVQKFEKTQEFKRNARI